MAGLGLLALVESWQMGLGTLRSPGPGLWPFYCSLVLVAFSGLSLLSPEGGDDESGVLRLRLLVVAALSLVVYLVAFSAVGMLVPTFLVLLFWLKVLAVESWRFSLVTAVIGTAAFWFVFSVMLKVPFPA